MKYKVAFICVHNSCRSQMAEGLAKKFGSDLLEVYSAGTEIYNEVKPKAIAVMEEIGIDMSGYRPKLITEIPNELDILITMGCNVICPYIPNKHMEDWGIDDPSGKSVEEFRKARDIIQMKVEKMIEDLKNNKNTNW